MDSPASSSSSSTTYTSDDSDVNDNDTNDNVNDNTIGSNDEEEEGEEEEEEEEWRPFRPNRGNPFPDEDFTGDWTYSSSPINPPPCVSPCSYSHLTMVLNCGICGITTGPHHRLDANFLHGKGAECSNCHHTHRTFQKPCTNPEHDHYVERQNVEEEERGECDGCEHIIVKESMGCWCCGRLYWGGRDDEMACRGCRYPVDSSWVKRWSLWRYTIKDDGSGWSNPTWVEPVVRVEPWTAEEVAERLLG